MIFHFRHRTAIALATLIVAFVSARGLGEEPTKTRPEIEQSIVKLLQKRRAVLVQLVKVQTQAYAQGEADIEAVVQAHQELLLVELELAEDHDERIELLKKAVRLATELESIAEAKYKAAEARQSDVLKSQGERLKAETDLLRERQKAKKD